MASEAASFPTWFLRSLAYEMNAHEVHAHEIHAHEMHAHEMYESGNF